VAAFVVKTFPGKKPSGYRNDDKLDLQLRGQSTDYTSFPFNPNIGNRIGGGSIPSKLGSVG